MLIVKPLSKEMIGNHEIFLRAVDKFGASSTIKLSIDVLNVNEPPRVNRVEATQISNYLWEEEIEITPDKTDFNLDLIQTVSPSLPKKNFLALFSIPTISKPFLEKNSEDSEPTRPQEPVIKATFI